MVPVPSSAPAREAPHCVVLNGQGVVRSRNCRRACLDRRRNMPHQICHRLQNGRYLPSLRGIQTTAELCRQSEAPS